MYSVAYLTFLKKGTRKFANYTIDLTPWLRGFDGDELSLELDLHIGKELTIDDPVIIPEWEDTPETDLSNL